MQRYESTDELAGLLFAPVLEYMGTFWPSARRKMDLAAMN